MTVVALPPRGAWIPDARESGRALRVSWHPEAGCVVLSSWEHDRCTGTTRLAPEEAAQLVAVLAQGLADQVPAAAAQPGHTGTDPV